jgi:hypothetical protein
MSGTGVRALLTSMRHSCGEELRGIQQANAWSCCLLLDDSLMLRLRIPGNRLTMQWTKSHATFLSNDASVLSDKKTKARRLRACT